MTDPCAIIVVHVKDRQSPQIEVVSCIISTLIKTENGVMLLWDHGKLLVL